MFLLIHLPRKQRFEPCAAGVGLPVPRGGGGGAGLGGHRIAHFAPQVPEFVVGVLAGLGVFLVEAAQGMAFAVLDIGLARGIGQTGGLRRALTLAQREEHVVEFFGEAVDRGAGLGGAGIEPREVGEQQPRIKALSLPHGLAAIPDRLGRPHDRPLGQDLLRRRPRMKQGRLPPGGKGRIAAAAHISRLLRNPRRQRRRAHIARPAEVFEETRDEEGRESMAPGERRGGHKSPLLFRGGGLGVVAFGLKCGCR
ncbi:MAG: hypothetical protein B7Y36_11290 [Novosphingobium sp. 28-62-57]|nr:MAG: hypothetical protein B7Z34_03545 [Novosphingobium sp. 12-62-10]OYZ09960.1 MAG: hypothetical protein B7Y36_11290 [Novosphingobium sp. 28-62-57]